MEHNTAKRNERKKGAPRKFAYLKPADIKPEGWLRRQLELQAQGLAGHLDLIWPDVRDSRWIGGDREGWERVPYWLDGFIPLAWLLEDRGLQKRAERYISLRAAGGRLDLSLRHGGAGALRCVGGVPDLQGAGGVPGV